jgi:K(+)-stimulated pyrophosphate-energized sodium pump
VDVINYIIPISAVIGLLFAFWKAGWIKKQEVGNETMAKIAKHIQDGAMAFLSKEYKALSIFVVAVTILLYFGYRNDADSSPLIAVSFVVGALLSALAGYIGMKVATNANVRTTNAARNSINEALQIAFSGGAVMGLSVVGLAVLGLSGLFLGFQGYFGSATDMSLMDKTLTTLSGFSLGASSIALFARVGGGIYTKAADVGADLVGKVEAGIPEDDPRNPAVIADNVGDNVGDVAGMGADLFESFAGAIIGSMIIGLGIYGTYEVIILPLLLAGIGIIVSVVGTFFVKTKEGGSPQVALNVGTFGSAGIMAIASYFIIDHLIPANSMTVFLSTLFGLAGGTAIGLITEHYTGESKKPVHQIAQDSTTGAATNIISGLGVGMKSTALPVIVIAAVIVASYSVAGLYGISMAALGMLSTTGIQLAVDAYGPIADNAGGIAEMSGLPPEVREKTDKLDAVGNTTAAIGKGFAIGSAALTAIALFSAFTQKANLTSIDITDPKIMAGLFIGGMLPFLFSSMAMKAVGEAAFDMIKEVRRQFREIPGLMEGKAEAEFSKCVEISTAASIKQMVLPGLLAVVTSVLVGFYDVGALGGLLAGVTVSGVTLAIFMSNAGGAWDNAKKHIEGGHYGGKGSDAHKAAVVGDTVGDPFKDTAGPALNILIKLMSVVGLILAPILV